MATKRTQSRVKQNWPFPKKKPAVKRRKSGLTVSQSVAAAFKAGQKSGDDGLFNSWLEDKGLADHGRPLRDRLSQSYTRGVLAGEGKAEKAETKRATAGTTYKGYRITYDGDDFVIPKLDPDSHFDTLADAKRFLDDWKKNPGRRNPAEASAAAYEEFHGRPSEELVTVRRKVHFHQHLAGAGELRKLVIVTPDGRYRVTLNQLKGALLCFNEDKNQLFVEGGNQRVDLKQFGIKSPHEVETLGKATLIDYHTTKDHLGDEGGTATYSHKFRMTNENGKHVTVRIARYPDVIYFVRDKQLVFSGGSYEIRAEGIDK